LDQGEVGNLLLMDTWLLVRMLETNGSGTGSSNVLKSRGMGPQ